MAGVALGLLTGINPLITAVIAAVASSVAIERLRISKRVYGESALSIFLSGSLALAIVLISLAHGFSVDLFNYLFGSIVTVRDIDVSIMLALATIVIVCIIFFFKELVFVTFDEEAAQVSGIPTRFINVMLIVLAAFTVALSIPIVGVLLISALIVVPVITALQFKKGFVQTILIGEAISILSVILGIIVSFYLNLSTGGTIVLITLAVFLITFFLKKK